MYSLFAVIFFFPAIDIIISKYALYHLTGRYRKCEAGGIQKLLSVSCLHTLIFVLTSDIL